jgi:hypothetical protein
VVEQRFRKPQVSSSNLEIGSRRFLLRSVSSVRRPGDARFCIGPTIR